LDSYAAMTGKNVIRHLQQLAALLKGKTVVHVISTRVGRVDRIELSWGR
jgi:trehalose synthase